MNTTHGITELLHAASTGDEDARQQLLPFLYKELHALAHHQLLGSGGGQRTLCTTALVHEAFLRLAAQQQVSFEDRAHFLAYCGRVMRSIVVDQARRQLAEKRGGQLVRVEWHDQHVTGGRSPEQVLALDQALDQLQAVDDRMARITELRVFGGLSNAECGVSLGVSERTIKRDWRKARAVLTTLLEPMPSD